MNQLKKDLLKTILDLKNCREKTILTLRKDTIYRKNMKERLSSFSSENQEHFDYEYEFTKEELEIDNSKEKSIKLTPLEILAFSTNQILSKNDHAIKYSIRQIRTYLSSLVTKKIKPQLQIENIFEPPFCEHLLNKFLEENNYKIIYEISFILINIVFLSDKYCQLIALRFSEIFDKVLSCEDFVIKKQLLWIIAQIISKDTDKYIAYFLSQNPRFKTFIFDQIETQYQHVNYYSVNLLIYSSFYDYQPFKSEMLSKCLTHIPLVSKYTRTTLNLHVFLEAINLIRKFLINFSLSDTSTISLHFKEDVIRMLSNCKFSSHLPKFLFNPSDDQTNDLVIEYRTNICKILMIISYYSEREVDKMVENGIIDKIEKNLEIIIGNPGIKREFIQNLLNLLYNILDSQNSEANYSVGVGSNICRYLIEMVNSRQFQDRVADISEIINCLINLDNRSIQFELIMVGAPEALDDMLFFFGRTNKEFLKFVLNSMKKLLEYGREVSVEGVNMVLRRLEEKSTRSKLEEISMMYDNYDDEVSEVASELIRTYFSG